MRNRTKERGKSVVIKNDDNTLKREREGDKKKKKEKGEKGNQILEEKISPKKNQKGREKERKEG